MLPVPRRLVMALAPTVRAFVFLSAAVPGCSTDARLGFVRDGSLGPDRPTDTKSNIARKPVGMMGCLPPSAAHGCAGSRRTCAGRMRHCNNTRCFPAHGVPMAPACGPSAQPTPYPPVAYFGGFRMRVAWAQPAAQQHERTT